MFGMRYHLGEYNSKVYSYPKPSLNFTEWLYVEYGFEPWDTPDDWVLLQLLKEYNKIHFFEPTNY
jgi:hypothetical protein